MDDDNWDLNAVVRGCRSSAETRDPFSSFPPPMLQVEEEEGKAGAFLCFPDLFERPPVALLELEELCKPFFSKELQQQQLQLSSLLTVEAGLPIQLPPPPARPTHRNISQNSRSKRRKNQQKKVICHVPADGLSSDRWSWRKYGQKPIKGSPYPRGYYRCSSSKSCLARKQVERSRADPGMFIITYTEEHNHPMPTHRNSLAGSTRHKFPAPHSSPAGGEGGDDQPPSNHSSSSPPSTSTAAGFSPTTPLTSSIEDELLLRRESSKGDQEDGEDEALDEEEEDDEQGMLLVEDMEVIGEDDLFFIGSEDILGSTIGSIAAPTAAVLFDEGDGLGDRFIASTRWLSNSNNNTAAAAGGS